MKTRGRVIAILACLTFVGLIGGCLIQIVKLVTVEMGNLSAINGASSAGMYVDLAEENSTYADNKDKFVDVVDVAVLGLFKNNLGAAVSADVWIVESPSDPLLLPDLAAVQAAGGKKVWSLSLGPNESKALTWDNSAALFTAAGKAALKNELEEDALFTLYVFGDTDTYDVTVTDASVAVMIDVTPSGF